MMATDSGFEESLDEGEFVDIGPEEEELAADPLDDLVVAGGVGVVAAAVAAVGVAGGGEAAGGGAAG